MTTSLRPFALLACTVLAGPALAQPLSVTDGNGRVLTLPGSPQRIVCMLNRCAQELAFIDAVVPVGFGAPYTYNVAVDPANFGEAARSAAQIPKEDGGNLEAIAALTPDFVIGEVDQATSLAGVAPVYTLNWDPPLNVDAFLSDVRNYADLLGVRAQTERKIEQVLARVATYAARSPKTDTVAIVSFADGDNSFWLPPDCGLFLSQATPCARDEAGEWIEGGVELLLRYDPDVLIVEDYGTGSDAAGLAAQDNNPLWRELSAVKNGRVHLVSVSAARMNTIQSVAAAMDRLMPLIYPQTFPASLTDAEIVAAEQ